MLGKSPYAIKNRREARKKKADDHDLGPDLGSRVLIPGCVGVLLRSVVGDNQIYFVLSCIDYYLAISLSGHS